jgi:hypothetical protein
MYGWFSPYGWFVNPWLAPGGNVVATELEIYNLVCAHLGEPLLTALPSTKKIATLLDAVYPTVRDDLLRDHQWNFAIKREALVASATPAYGFDYSFLIPPQCLRVIDTDPDKVAYSIEGVEILTDESSLSLRYVERITDESLFDIKFTKAFAALLAARICYNLTGSHQREVDLTSLAQSYVPPAKAVGGLEEPTENTELWYESMVS